VGDKVIVIINYGVGNLGSILNMLKKIGVPAKISSCQQDIMEAAGLILPGVGAFDTGMTKLEESGYLAVLNEKVLQQKTSVLGICLGMQMLSRKSEEGVLPGLGWIDAETVRFPSGESDSLKIPHMGWNELMPQRDLLLMRGFEGENRFYFVHSYHVVCKNGEDVLATTHYGNDFCSVVQHGNIMGTQFHPEKSHKFGMQLLKNFAECCI
jgi:glutamine amidotransferase